MASTLQWPVFNGSENPIDMLVGVSRYYGADPDFVLAGGGNTSVKIGDRLLVKGSGHALATIAPDGFVDLDRNALQTLLGRELSTDKKEREEQFKQAVMAARREPQKNQRPSVEAVLHHLMPGQLVVHTHATLVNAFTCCSKGKQIIQQALANDVIWIDDVDPGFVLAKTLQGALAAFEKKTGKARPRAIIMQNHGLVISGDTPAEIKQHTDWLLGELSALLKKTSGDGSFGAVNRIEASQTRPLINTIGPALRSLLSTGESLKIVTFDDSQEVMSLVAADMGKDIATAGPLTPDQIVYCKSFPLWFETQAGESTEQLTQRLAHAVKEYEQTRRVMPNVILVKGLGLFAAGDGWSGANTVRVVYTDAIKVMSSARKLGGIGYLNSDLRKFIEEWEVESYRRQVSAAKAGAGRAVGKVALVTGAAQGFGLEIAQDLAAQGGHVVLADMNVEGAKKAAAALCQKLGEGRAIGLAINVTDGASVEESLHQTVRMYGGLDVLVSNAGVLKAGSVKTQPEKDFDFTTAVNYKGYFLCVQKTAPILAIQHQVKKEYWSDIIQINSKSGLVGSNKNGAYAGGKFGGIGLTQSFALELVEDCIKVNSICPGNFFDGPLWSDPNNGLFVQYLRANKVPGAKTIEDVKKFYESKVPMNRGCTTPDVMKAIYYLIEQKYETGQAVPVTGGQVMLH